MRPSKRTEILDAALRVVERAGVPAVTFDSVARESGLTKGGLVYHFPSREALLIALQDYLANQWKVDLVRAAGKPVSETTSQERAAAYTRVATTSATRAELMLIAEAATDPALSAPWAKLMDEWAPPAPSKTPLTNEELDLLIAHLAADGLWIYETITGISLPQDAKEQLGKRILKITRQQDD